MAQKNCPYKTDLCKQICYGRNAQELFPRVYNSRIRNYEESLKKTFERDMINIINHHLQRKKYKDKIIFFRWHETGDFYNQEYFDKVIRICNYFKNNKKIIFQAYTKSLPFIINSPIKDKNIRIMFSVMKDTKKEYIELAKKMNINLFYAIPEKEFKNIKEKNKCYGNCGQCNKCYTKNQDMYVLYHGIRAPKRKSKIKLNHTLYWRKDYKK